MKKGIYYALLTSVISGIAIFYAKISVAKIDPLILTTSRNLWAASLFMMLWIIRGRWGIGEIRGLKKKDLFQLILIGIIGGALPFYLFFTGLKLANPTTANFIHKSLFVWVAFLATIFLNEKFNPLYWASFFLIFVGNLFLAPKSSVLGRGEVMIYCATLLWALENILAKKILKNVSSELVGLFRMGLGSLILLMTVITTGKGQALLALNWSQLSIIMIGGTILFFYVFTWFKALKYAPASLVTMVLTFSVVVGNILNGSFAGVKLLNMDIYSSLLILAATCLLLVKSKWTNKAY